MIAYADDSTLNAHYRSLSPCGEAVCGSIGKCVCAELATECDPDGRFHVYDVIDGKRLADVCRCKRRRLRKME